MNLPPWLEYLYLHSAEASSFELLVRFTFVLFCVGGCAILWHLAPIPLREKKAAVAASLVHLLFASMIELALIDRVYSYHFTQQMLWGVPFDVQLGWASLWGAGLCISWRWAGGAKKYVLVAVVILLTLAMDFAALKTGRVFTPLTPLWIVWDAAALVFLAITTLGFYTLILEHRTLYLRVMVYGFVYAFVFYVLVPALILELSGRPSLVTHIFEPKYLIALVACSIPGLVATIQFEMYGDGTPLPLDPTRKLVTNGVYAYIRNPMQVSGLLAAIIWALAAQSWYLWVYVVDLAILLQLTKVFEDRELFDRFGDEFEHYRRNVWLWIPKFHAYQKHAGLKEPLQVD